VLPADQVSISVTGFVLLYGIRLYSSLKTDITEKTIINFSNFAETNVKSTRYKMIIFSLMILLLTIGRVAVRLKTGNFLPIKKLTTFTAGPGKYEFTITDPGFGPYIIRLNLKIFNIALLCLQFCSISAIIFNPNPGTIQVY
jgi:hypothetical protein